MSHASLIVQSQELPELHLPAQTALKALAHAVHMIELMFLDLVPDRNFSLQDGDMLVLPRNHSEYRPYINLLPPRLRDRVFFYSRVTVPRLIFTTEYVRLYHRKEIRHHPEGLAEYPNMGQLNTAFVTLLATFPNESKNQIGEECFPGIPVMAWVNPVR